MVKQQAEALRLADALERAGIAGGNRHKAATELRRLYAALQTIEQWSSHSVDLALDYGSNGVRDFYRGIARAAIAKATGEQQ